MTTQRFARLTLDWQLRGWQDAPASLVNCRTGAVLDLDRDEFYVADACDGRVNFASLAFLPAHRELLDRFVARGVAEDCALPTSIDAAQEYRRAANSRVQKIQWAVTGHCNLRCRHCYVGSPSARFGELSTEDCETLIGRFAAANVVSIALTGGEPFLREDLCHLVAVMSAARLRICDIYTNATMITDRHLAAIARLRNRPVFRISFDGCGAHDRWRGARGVAAAVIEAIPAIRGAGFPVTVITSLDRTNTGCLMETYELLKRLDSEEWGIGRPQHAGEWKRASTQLSLAGLAAACTPLLERWAADGRPFTIAFEGLYSARGADRNTWLASRRAATDPFVPSDYACGVCRTSAYVAPDGTLLPCLAYQDSGFETRMPNLLHASLASAWHDPSIRALLDVRKGDVVARNPECATCEFLGGCAGGCRACGLAAGGDVLARDPVMCEVWRGGYRPYFAALAARLLPGDAADRGR